MTKIAVAIASLGRPDTVAESLLALSQQSRLPDEIVLSVTSENDLPSNLNRDDVKVVMGSKGLCAQRNRVLSHLGNKFEYIVFFDDDYVPSRYALENIVRFMDANPDIVGITGHVIADGIKSQGITYETAVKIVADYDKRSAPETEISEDSHALYGCNMAYRSSAIKDTQFDENLPYYGWLEDCDFSNQLLSEGKLVRTNAFAGVHCGVKVARSPGVRLGYSQIANPVYLGRKGTLPWNHGLKLMTRNMIANHVRSFHPEPWVDRWGRVRGNWLAIKHLILGKLSPTFIVEL